MAGGEIFRRGQDGSQERAVVSGRVATRPATSTPGPVVQAEQFRDRFVTSPEVDKIRDLRVKIETMSQHASQDVAAFGARIEAARQAQTLTWTPPAWKPTQLSHVVLSRLAAVRKTSRATHQTAQRIALSIETLDRTPQDEQQETPA